MAWSDAAPEPGPSVRFCREDEAMSTTPRSSSESPSQTMDIRIGTEVYCGSDKAGKVERVVISPRRQTVTHLIVGRGMVLHKDIVVPIERVVHADEERVDLDLTIDE